MLNLYNGAFSPVHLLTEVLNKETSPYSHPIHNHTFTETPTANISLFSDRLFTENKMANPEIP